MDALRGLTVAAMLLVNDAGDWSHVHPWLAHARWHGVAPPDYVFPFFLFIVGVSISLALTPRVEAGVARGKLAREVLARALRIVALGLLLHALQWEWVDSARDFRPMGVLQRIGVCYAAGGLIALFLPQARLQWLLFGALVLGWWALLAGTGPLEPGVNLADRVDTALLGSHAYVWDVTTRIGRDPEGVLSTLPAIATVLLGMRAGDLLRTRRDGLLMAGGVLALALGALWSLVFPLNKHLWTSSYVLWTGGCAMLAVALAHLAVDRRRWPAIGRSLGINAIAAYAGAWILACVLAGTGAQRTLYDALFANRFEPWVASAAYAAAFTALWWAAAALCARRGWRITI